jgi:homoserine dehydrogenase
MAGRELGIALVGVGTVGGGVARLLEAERHRLATRAGRPLRLVRGVVRDLSRPRPGGLGCDRLTTNWRDAVHDPGVDVVVELLGGVTPAREVVLESLAAGKDVVTANKALLADHGTEIFAAARRAGRVVAFEAAVAGGIPIIQALSCGLAANQVQGLAAIVNGTCNFILSAMSGRELAYESALRQAQELGYAEADPRLDVDGTDTAHKLALLVQLAFGVNVTTVDVPRQGIDRLETLDLKFASELGYAIKLLALARLADDDAVELDVAPRLVRLGTPLADVRGAYNAIRVVGDVVGDTLFYGLGAGAMPTASAILGDLVDVACGRAARSFAVQGLWSDAAETRRTVRPGPARCRHYLRFMILDRPGALGQIAAVLGRHGISIASVIQHDPGENDGPDAPVPLILMTHVVDAKALRAAVEEADRLEVVRPPSVSYGVED